MRLFRSLITILALSLASLAQVPTQQRALSLPAFVPNYSIPGRPLLSGLNVSIGTGTLLINGAPTTYPATTMTVTNNATTYIYVDLGSGLETQNTTGFLAQYYPICIAVAVNGTITTLTDSRPDVAGAGGSFSGVTPGSGINTQTAPAYVNSPLDPTGGTWGGSVFNWYLNDTSTSGDTAAFGSLDSVNCLTAWTSSPSRGFGCQLINVTTPVNYANNLNVAYEGQRLLLIPQGSMNSNQIVAGANWQVYWQSTGSLTNNLYGHTIQTAVTNGGSVTTAITFDAISGTQSGTIANDVDFEADSRGSFPTNITAGHWGFHCGSNSSTGQSNSITAALGVGGTWCIYDQTSVLGAGRNHLDSIWVPGAIRTSVAGCSVAGCGASSGAGGNSDLAGVLSYSSATTASYTFAQKEGTNTSAPVCVISPISPGTTTFSITTLSSTTLTVTASATFTGSVNYICIGRN